MGGPEGGVEAWINYVAPMEERPRFHAQDHARDNIVLDPRRVAIADGRAAPPSLDVEGIALVPHRTAVADFRDPAAAMAVYRPELERLIGELSGASRVVVMGGAGLRFSKRSSEFGTGINSQPAGFVHVDYTDRSAPELLSGRLFGGEPHTIRPGQRIAGYNIWRVVSDPPQDTPLAVCDARTVATADLVRADAVFDVGEAPWMTFEAFLLKADPAHRWLYFSNMLPGEALVFKSFDTEPGRPVRVPHTAFEHPRTPADAPGRVSVEARAFAIFD